MIPRPIPVRKAGVQFERIAAAIVERLDGRARAPLVTILSPAWSDAERAEYGVFIAEPASVPDGYRSTGYRFEQGEDEIVRQVHDLEAIPATLEHVIMERARRLSLGFDYDFGDDRGVHRIGTTDQDMAGWDEATKGAQAAINLGLGGMTLGIVTDTGAVSVTAMEWQMVLAAATQARQPIYAASFAIQAMDPIPSDYADDKWWS